MMKKTKREMFNEMLAIAVTEEQREFLKHEIELLNGKKAKKKTNPEEERIKELIITGMTNSEKDKFTVTEMLKEFDGMEDFTNQKISAYLKKLIAENEIVREEIKGKAYFKLGE